MNNTLDPNFNPNSADVIANNFAPTPYSRLMEKFDREVDGTDLPLNLPWEELGDAIGGGLLPGTVTMLVGDPGSAKTFIALSICVRMQRQGIPWAYWPLERDDTFALRRIVALRANNWDYLNPERSKEMRATLKADEYLRDFANKAQLNIEPAPGQRRTDAYGNEYYQGSTFNAVLERLDELFETRELVVMDPLSMLSFDATAGRHRDQWQAQEDFFKEVAQRVGGTRARMVFVHHPRKMPAGHSGTPSGHDMAGASAFNRFADNIIFVQHHQPKRAESEVMSPDGTVKTVSHKRSFFVAKCREGSGAGMRIACDMLERGPQVVEYGIIQEQSGLGIRKWERN